MIPTCIKCGGGVYHVKKSGETTTLKIPVREDLKKKPWKNHVKKISVRQRQFVHSQYKQPRCGNTEEHVCSEKKPWNQPSKNNRVGEARKITRA
jgi:hypothetical protein